MPDKAHSYWPAWGVLAALIVIRFLPFICGTAWLWGVSHLTLLPSWCSIAYGGLGALALGLPWLPQASTWGEQLARWYDRTFYLSRHKYLYRGVVLLVAGIMFTLFRVPTHFLGDGYNCLANIGSEAGAFVKRSDWGAMQAAVAVQSLLGARSEQTALQAYQIVSVASGLVTIWFYFLIAGVLTEDAVRRLLTFTALLLSSALLLFFGYVESYPILWAVISGFFYFSLRFATTGKGIIWALAFLVVAIVVHLFGVLFAVGFVFLVLSRGLGYRLYRRFRVIFLGAFALLIIAGGLLFYYKYTTDLSFENMFMYPFTGKPKDPGYAIVSARHIVDILNLFLLVVPIGFVMLVWSVANWRRAMSDHTAWYLGLSSLGSLAFLFVFDPGLSMPRDWDLFSLCLSAPVLLLLYMLPESHLAIVKRLCLPLVLSLFLFTMPFLLVNFGRTYSVNHIKQIVDNNPEKAFEMMSILMTYYTKGGDQSRADSVAAVAQVRYRNWFNLRRAYGLLIGGDVAGGEKLFRTTRHDIFSKDYHMFLAELYARKKMFDSALYHAETLVKLAPYFDRSYLTLGTVYAWRNESDKALAALRHGYALNNRSIEIIAGLATQHLASGAYDSVLFYGKRAITLDPNAVDAYRYLSQAYYGLGNRRESLNCARKYLDLGSSTPGYPFFRRQLISLFPELEAKNK